jgi:chromosome segregation ATPase
MARDRVEQMIFPDDLFTRKLGGPIDTLAGTTDSVSEGVASLAEDVKTATRQVTTAIRNLNAKTQTLDENLVAVGAIVTSQERLVSAMKQQSKEVMDSVERVQKEYLDSLDDQQEEYLNEIKTRQQSVERIADKLEALSIRIENADTVERLSTEVTDALRGVREVTQTNRDVLAERLELSLAPLIQALVESNEQHQGVAARIEQHNRAIETAYIQMDALITKIGDVSIGEMASQHSEPARPADARTA